MLFLPCYDTVSLYLINPRAYAYVDFMNWRKVCTKRRDLGIGTPASYYDIHIRLWETTKQVTLQRQLLGNNSGLQQRRRGEHYFRRVHADGL
jgi:hypothetical protein